MQKQQFLLFSLATSLMMVGGGCAMTQQTSVTAPETVPASVDAVVDAVIETGDEEQDAQAKVRQDAQLFGAENTDVNAYANSTYEPQ
jgi:uncharacterized lipoprotein YajG